MAFHDTFTFQVMEEGCLEVICERLFQEGMSHFMNLDHYQALDLCLDIAPSLTYPKINLVSILSVCPAFLAGISIVIIHHMSPANMFSHSSKLISHTAVILMVVCPIGEQELTGEGY